MIKRKGQLKTILTLCIITGLTSIVFAGNVIGDVPTGADENRTINRETTIYNGSCDLTQELAFYQGSPVYLRVGQPKGQVSYVFDKKETYVRVYNQNLFAGTLKFPYISNFVPSTTIDSTDGNILTVDATGATFASLTTITRNQPAGQFVTVNNERSVIQNANGVTLNYYYIRANDMSKNSGTMKVMINPTLTTKKSCTNYYVARCGDGTIDKATGNSDGNGGMTTQGGTFLPWHTISIKPNEVCDDGAQNGQSGKCKTDCTGIGGGETGNLIVAKTLTTEQAYTPGQTVQFKISFSNPTTQLIQNIAIEDLLPGGLEYISSEINGATAPVYFSTGIVQGNFRIAYTGFSLAAGQNGYILINAKLTSCAAKLNNAYWSATSNGQNLSGYTNKQVSCSSTPVSISKTASPTTIQGGQIVGFTIRANNSTTSTITNVRVEDVWPTCFSLVPGSVQTSLPATQTSGGNLTQWTLSSGLPAGQTFIITFSGQASTDPSCAGKAYDNIGRILYTEMQGNQPPQSTATVTISQSTLPVSIRKEVTQAGYGPGNPVQYTIIFKNIGTTAISGFRIIDKRPTSLIFRSSTLRSLGWKNYLPVNTNQNPLVWDFSSRIFQPQEEDAIRIYGEIIETLQ